MNIIEQLRKLQGRIRTLSFRKSHSDHQFATSLKLAREAFSNGAGLDEAVHKLDGVGDEFTALRVDTASDLIEAVRIGKQYEIQMPNCLLLRESFGENFENLVPLVCAELEALKLSLEVSTTKPTDSDKEIPASYRHNGATNGEPLTAEFVKDRFKISGAMLTRDGQKNRLKVGRGYVYQWKFVSKLANKNI